MCVIWHYAGICSTRVRSRSAQSTLLLLLLSVTFVYLCPHVDAISADEIHALRFVYWFRFRRTDLTIVTEQKQNPSSTMATTIT